MWQEIVASLTDDYKFAPPASEAEIRQAEEKLGVTFPRELRSFLLEANGLHANCGATIIGSVDSIVKDNLEYREIAAFKELYMPFECLLFFGDNGGGDRFAYGITSTGVNELYIYMWDHETDGRPCYSYSIERYLRQVLNYEYE